jgi:hypothetical protein
VVRCGKSCCGTPAKSKFTCNSMCVKKIYFENLNSWKIILVPEEGRSAEEHRCSMERHTPHPPRPHVQSACEALSLYLVLFFFSSLSLFPSLPFSLSLDLSRGPC